MRLVSQQKRAVFRVQKVIQVSELSVLLMCGHVLILRSLFCQVVQTWRWTSGHPQPPADSDLSWSQVWICGFFCAARWSHGPVGPMVHRAVDHQKGGIGAILFRAGGSNRNTTPPARASRSSSPKISQGPERRRGNRECHRAQPAVGSWRTSRRYRRRAEVGSLLRQLRPSYRQTSTQEERTAKVRTCTLLRPSIGQGTYGWSRMGVGGRIARDTG